MSNQSGRKPAVLEKHTVSEMDEETGTDYLKREKTLKKALISLSAIIGKTSDSKQ